jgi:hypothetical protein
MNQMDWQPIETAPKDGTYVLLSGDGHVSVGKWEEDSGRTLIAGDPPYWSPYDHSYWDRLIDDSWFAPTHWMPLPAPPS